MLSKEIAFVLPLVVAAYLAATSGGLRMRWGRLAPVLIGTGIALAWRFVALLATPEPIRRVPAVDPTTALPAFPLLAQALAGILVEASLVPAPIKLTHDYSWLLTVHGAGLILLALGGLGLAGGAVWILLRRDTTGPVRAFAALAVAPLLAAALLAGASGSVASERTLYYALPGWIGLALWGGHRLTQRRKDLRPLLLGLAAGVVVVFAVRTLARIPLFESEETLLAAGLASHPDNPQLIFERGNQKLVKLDYEGAVEDYEKAIALRSPRPEYPMAFPMASLNLAVARINQEELGLALRILDPVALGSMHVRSLRMIDARAQYHAGLVLQRQDRTKEAAEAFERTLLFYPDHRGARGNLGLIYVRAPHYVERGLELLRGVLKEETDPDRKILLQKTATRAEGLLRDYVNEYGEVPSKRESPEDGAIGEPWKAAAALGM
jgi:tetratricopeptide (TPR) repeat protein